GVGLGLYLANKLICLHGGALHIESLLGHGTTVTISLPARRVCGEGNSKQPTISSTVTPALPKETCGTHVNEQAAVRHSLQ
ncbi:MAG: ATP-binding protein, partial [Nitrospiraceae bacterium]